MISGATSINHDINVAEKMKVDCKESEMSVSTKPICLELPDAAISQDEHKAETIEENVYEYAAAMEGNIQEGCIAKEMDGGSDRLARKLKPMLESDKGLDEPYAVSDTRGLESGMVAIEPSRSTCLTMSLGLYPVKDACNESSDLAALNATESFAGTVSPAVDMQDQMKVSGLTPIRHRQRQILPKQPSNQQSNRFETHKETSPQAPIRVARPPGEGRGRNQLLPRYWPRITDQELQQITSADSNSKITPLFEKMLSASDAGRIGRLVLPKACAEAYFPPISQPEGLPLKIQDISGKDWVFQFRFWPNNNSRMYVLEGVTPCIQSMSLQAGDTVTFSRLDPGGKLVMGYRRAPNSLSAQDTQPSTLGSNSNAITTLNSGGIDNISTIASLTGLLSQSVKSAAEAQVNGISGQLNFSETGYGWYKSDKAGSVAKEGSFFQSLLVADKRKGRQTNSKGKRPRVEMEESLEFKISWEEAQDLLRPPPHVTPSIITIEGHEFEEYEEPPVFGKRTIFTTRKFGSGEDQWAQCDDCGSWRKVPTDVFLATRWTCTDNVWDAKRSSCNSPQEVSNEEIDLLLHQIKDSKKQEVVKSLKTTEPSSGLETLATAATLGENNNVSSSSPAATTKHPRHRPGCTCIVCIQPPSGKGPKHKPSCNCNVCMTVKRRFKTLMMRRKKRQCEREAETAARKKRSWSKEDGEVETGGKWQTDIHNVSENGSRQENFPVDLPRINNLQSSGNRVSSHVAVPSSYPPKCRSSGDENLSRKGQIDLNSQPEKEDETSRSGGRVSMVRMLQNASYPLERYLKQQGLTSLICPQQVLVPSMSFVRNMISQKVDENNGNQHVTAIAADRAQKESYMTLGMSNLDPTALTQGFEVMEWKPALQGSSQSS